MSFDINMSTVISSSSSDYKVLAILGAGTFGEVTKCLKTATQETVAIKLLKDNNRIEEGEHEAAVLNMLQEKGSDSNNIVQFNGSFTFRDRFCLEFEELDRTLYDFMSELGSLQAIRAVVQQLATSLDFLDTQGFIHADLKPENIMMVDAIQQPLRVKLIDFGLAHNNPEAYRGDKLQTLWYRAPEIILGAQYNQAIDVWSLGCLMMEMLKNDVLFPAFTHYDLLRHIIHTIGMPPDHLIEDGQHSKRFFKEESQDLSPFRWSLKSPRDVKGRHTPVRAFKSLEEHVSKAAGRMPQSHWAPFLDLVTRCLKVDPAERITPRQILLHPFLTMDLPEEPRSCDRKRESSSTGDAGKDKNYIPLVQGPDTKMPSSPDCTISPEPQSPPLQRKRKGTGRSGCTPAVTKRAKLDEAEAPVAKDGTSPQEMLLSQRKRTFDKQASSGSPPAKRSRESPRAGSGGRVKDIPLTPYQHTKVSYGPPSSSDSIICLGSCSPPMQTESPGCTPADKKGRERGKRKRPDSDELSEGGSPPTKRSWKR